MSRVVLFHLGGWIIALATLHLTALADEVLAGPWTWAALGTIFAITTASTALGAASERRRRALLEADLRAKARIDPLTGLPNRLALEEELERAMARAARRGIRVALAFVDLDGLKEANDRYGHDAGDYLLVHAAHRLKEAVRAEDLAARWGGDEFVVLLTEVEGVEGAAAIGQRIVDVLGTEVTWEGRDIASSASVGIALHPDDSNSAFGLLKAADRAMYEAKASGGSRCVLAWPRR